MPTLDTIDRKLSKLADSFAEFKRGQNRKTWVTAQFILKRTNLTKEELRTLRLTNQIEVKREGNSVRYCLQSIPKELFI